MPDKHSEKLHQVELHPAPRAEHYRDLPSQLREFSRRCWAFNSGLINDDQTQLCLVETHESVPGTVSDELGKARDRRRRSTVRYCRSLRSERSRRDLGVDLIARHCTEGASQNAAYAATAVRNRVPRPPGCRSRKFSIWSDDGGAVAVIFALAATVLVAILGLGVDVGFGIAQSAICKMRQTRLPLPPPATGRARTSRRRRPSRHNMGSSPEPVALRLHP